jgi:hypothetical protein
MTAVLIAICPGLLENTPLITRAKPITNPIQVNFFTYTPSQQIVADHFEYYIRNPRVPRSQAAWNRIMLPGSNP